MVDESREKNGDQAIGHSESAVEKNKLYTAKDFPATLIILR